MGIIKNTRRVINKNGHNKVVLKEHIQFYLNNGWSMGMSQNNKDRIKKSIHNKFEIDPSSKENWGRASTEEKEELRKRKISETMKGNTNWKFNKRRGNGKKGWYDGIFCDSAWELAFVLYYKEHNLRIERCKESRNYIFEGRIHKYYPDFITDEGIVEVKGIKNKKWLEKNKQHPDIIIYDAKKMKPILDYVINKYGDEFWNILYEK